MFRCPTCHQVIGCENCSRLEVKTEGNVMHWICKETKSVRASFTINEFNFHMHLDACPLHPAIGVIRVI